MRRVVLIGFRGTGKSLTGKNLSKMLNLPFFDTDEHIERRAGRSISSIFAQDGEAHFRGLEQNVIASLPKEHAVISTGGGAVLDPRNVELLKADSTCFLLQASPEEITRRIRESSRPPLTQMPLDEEVRELLRLRRTSYIAAADYCIDTGAISPDETAGVIARILMEGTAPSLCEGEDGFLQRAGLGSWDIPKRTGDASSHRLYAIVGNPCAHSRSPGMYNRLFSYYRLNNFYGRIQWHDIGEIISHARRCDLRGLSITIPFKQDVVRHIDEIDCHADAIGAVNTIVHCGGTMYGFNTDWLGVRRPIEHLKGSRAVLFGAGGAAAAAAYALVSLEMDLTILNRTPHRAEVLVQRFGGRSGALSEFARVDPDVVVNATPVGMEPDQRSLLAAADLKEEMTVFDLVYTPPETPFLREAKKAGSTVISGTEMFVHQACEQFRLFTGIAAPESMVREMI